MENLHWAVLIMTFVIAGSIAFLLMLMYRKQDTQEWFDDRREGERRTTDRRSRDRRAGPRQGNGTGQRRDDDERRRTDRRHNDQWLDDYRQLKEEVDENVNARRDF